MIAREVTVSAPDHDDLVVVAGELDVSSCPRVRDAVVSMLVYCGRPRGAAETGWSRLGIVDLSVVTFVASAGLSLLLELDARARASGVDLCLVVSPQSTLATAIRRTGLAQVLTMAADLDEARSLRSRTWHFSEAAAAALGRRPSMTAGGSVSPSGATRSATRPPATTIRRRRS